MNDKENLFPQGFFLREDERDDAVFYASPRFETFIDEPGHVALEDLYRQFLPDYGVILDLMTGWESHLPTGLPCTVYGLGMNGEELVANPRLNEFGLHDLNRDPEIPYPDDYFDAVLCAGSVEYLVHPLVVFAQANRVLKSGGLFIVSFSERSYAEKVLEGWKTLNAAQHVALVASYFAISGNWGVVNTRFKTLLGSDPLFMLWAQKAS